MEKRHVRRIQLELTPAQKRKLRRIRKMVAAELPDLIRRNQMAHDARKGISFSATLRKAILGSKLLLPQLASRTQVTMEDLSDFLTGEKPLTTDQVDSLVVLLGWELRKTVKQKPRTAKAG